MLCPNCKNEIENGSKFCEHCGARVKKSKKWLWITIVILGAVIIAAVVGGIIQRQQQVYENLVIAFEQQQTEVRQQESDNQLDAELARKETALKAEAERKAELARQGFVDLGLPSGTCWRNYNEGGDNALYDYDEAVSRFGNNLPTMQQLEELKDNCTWIWIRSGGYKVIGPNGNSIYLPAAGIYDPFSEVLCYVGMQGSYWSFTPYASGSAWRLFFDSSEVDMPNCGHCFKISVRLVMNP